MQVALLFPGQGAQTPGFLRRLPEHPAVGATLDDARQILGESLDELDSAAALASTAAVQLGTVIAGVAAARALRAAGVEADAVAGLSVGAFAAAVACGALSFADALRLVKLRAESMAQTTPTGFGMAAILGLPERRVLELIARVSERAPLYLASINAPTEIVVSGSSAALALAAQEAHTNGAAIRVLRVVIPSHCPLMDGVSARLRAAARGVTWQRPRMPYVSNHRARATVEAEEVAEDLMLNVSRPVRWHDSVTLLYELGCRVYLETPPGQVLSRLMEAAFPDVRAASLEDVPLASAVSLARRPPGA
jgi:malonate decarboxylase epsilon subunit